MPITSVITPIMNVMPLLQASYPSYECHNPGANMATPMACVYSKLYMYSAFHLMALQAIAIIKEWFVDILFGIFVHSPCLVIKVVHEA